MKWAWSSIVLTAALAISAGCGKAKPGGDDAASSETEGSWTFRSEAHDFTLTLPSAQWKQNPKGKFIADFYCPDVSPMLAGVTSVQKQTFEQFQASIPN